METFRNILDTIISSTWFRLMPALGCLIVTFPRSGVLKALSGLNPVVQIGCLVVLMVNLVLVLSDLETELTYLLERR